MPDAVNLKQKLTLFSEHWSPKIVSAYNGNDVMVVKFQGAFPWHKHESTDDFFLVIEGHIRLETEQGNVELGPGELYVVPRGVLHRPVAEQEAQVLLIEPKGEPNSGDPATAATKVWI
ncbi:MAG: cupin domain-containing protein [Devosia nanyangense]|uniref:Cupin domain-containing protein n=1 Tax=Devosia nanyangense TaxID=1228055 RepID=A0A933KY91_9HYPH|nr:cupin domain-containing protein [Devosia nanyangense]